MKLYEFISQLISRDLTTQTLDLLLPGKCTKI